MNSELAAIIDNIVEPNYGLSILIVNGGWLELIKVSNALNEALIEYDPKGVELEVVGNEKHLNVFCRSGDQLGHLSMIHNTVDTCERLAGFCREDRVRVLVLGEPLKGSQKMIVEATVGHAKDGCVTTLSCM